ncbi:MAG: bifunctional methylenetetrahydrofolate dehydrogenase/methenyltetrahydrofolate cyclohydrolase FolD [candidate division FCPU426 bacterium]
MTAQIIDGKAQAARLCGELQGQIAAFRARSGRPPGLAVVLVGDDEASHIYVRGKRKRGEELGFRAFTEDYPASVSEDDLLAVIGRLNADPHVDGILVQLPLPKHISSERVLAAVDPDKDVDGFNPANMGRLLAGHPRFVPCTAAGIMALIRSTGISLPGKKAVVVGRSNIVGKPTALLLLHEHATVTLCHSRTENLAAECRTADVLVVAVGKKFCILGDFIKPGAVVIDVGINRDESGLCGDVAFAQAREKAGHITPVPGGVGPMTIAMLMANTLRAAAQREEQRA